MDITAGVYPDFATETSLEELVLNMARKFLELQKDLTINEVGFDYINLTIDEEAETATVELEDVPASVTDGIIAVAEAPFKTQPTFTAGTGSWPFNRSHLLDALFHCIIYQSSLEVNRTANNNENAVYIDWQIGAADSGAVRPCIITASLTDIPIEVALYQPSKGKPYLTNP